MIRRLYCEFNPDDRHCHEPNDTDTDSNSNVFQKRGDGDDEADEVDEVDEGDGVDDEVEEVEADCTSDADGNYGLSTDQFQEMVTYRYQVQTTVGLSGDVLNDQVLDDLEKALSDELVTDLFDECFVSGSGSGGTRGRRQQRRRQLRIQQQQQRRFLQQTVAESELTGLRSDPQDEIVAGFDGVTCRTPLVLGADRCFVIDGGFTLLGPENITWAVPLAKTFTKSAMNGGSLNDVHPDVVNVKFLDEDVSDGFGEEEPGSSTTDDRPGSNNNATTDTDTADGDDPDTGVTRVSSRGGGGSITQQAWPWVVLGCGVFVVIAILALMRRRLGRNRLEREYEEAVTRLPTSSSGEGGSSDNVYLQEDDVEGDVDYDEAQQKTAKDPIVLSSSGGGGEGLRPSNFDTDADSFDARRRHFV